MKIRKAKLEDLEGILKLSQLHFEMEQKAFDDKLNLEWTYSEKGEKFFTDFFDNENKCGWVAVDGEKTIGYNFGSAYDEPVYNLKMADIGPIFVMEDYRGQGIGSKLMDEFLKWAKEKEIKRAVVVAHYHNNESIKFYKKQGLKDFHLKLKIDL